MPRIPSPRREMVQMSWCLHESPNNDKIQDFTRESFFRPHILLVRKSGKLVEVLYPGVSSRFPKLGLANR